jgi:hypothetical protein
LFLQEGYFIQKSAAAHPAVTGDHLLFLVQAEAIQYHTNCKVGMMMQLKKQIRIFISLYLLQLGTLTKKQQQDTSNSVIAEVFGYSSQIRFFSLKGCSRSSFFWFHNFKFSLMVLNSLIQQFSKTGAATFKDAGSYCAELNHTTTLC